MSIFEGFILGIVQGLTEFLPVSSSGHLVLLQKIFGIGKGVFSFDVAVHVATLAAVFIIMRKDIAGIIKEPLGKLPLLIVIGTIPTVIIGALFKDLFKRIFESGATLGFEFILTGLILWYAESVKNKNKGLDKMTFMDASFIGIAQGIAVLPAVSRSGLTLAGGLFRGLNREFALRFSFLMSIPAILGAAVIGGYDIFKAGGGFQPGIEPGALVIGMLAAGASGCLAIRFMLRIVAKVSLKVFSYYVFILGVLIILEQIFVGKFFGRLF